MNKIIEKTKNILFKKPKAIDCDSARMLAMTGRVCTIEERMTEFMEDIDNSIENKAKYGKFMTLIQIPKDLISQTSSISDNLISRGFFIHTLEPEIKDSFLVSWKF